MTPPVTSPSIERARSELMTSDGWKWRRTLIFAVVFFLCALIGFLAWKDSGSPLATLAMTSAFTGVMTFVPAYVFAAMWDDRNKRFHAGRLGSFLSPVEGEGVSQGASDANPAQ